MRLEEFIVTTNLEVWAEVVNNKKVGNFFRFFSHSMIIVI